MDTSQIALFVLIIIFVLAVIAWAAWRYRSLAAPTETGIDPIDLAAFARLLDESDEDFIRRRLAPKDYKVARRKRIIAAIDYLRRARRNAGIMLRIGELALRSTDLALQNDARRLAQLSVQIRQQTTASLLRLSVALLFPDMSLDSRSVLARYAEMRRVAEAIQRLQPSLFVENS